MKNLKVNINIEHGNLNATVTYGPLDLTIAVPGFTGRITKALAARSQNAQA